MHLMVNFASSQMFESESMHVLEGRMNCTWKMSKLTYVSQKWLSKQEKIKQNDSCLTFRRYSNRNLKHNKIS